MSSSRFTRVAPPQPKTPKPKGCSVSETAKFWGSVVVTLVGSGAIAISIYWIERDASRSLERSLAVERARDSRAAALERFGASIYQSTEALYQYKLASIDWSAQVSKLSQDEFVEMTRFVDDTNAKAILAGMLEPSSIPESIRTLDDSLRSRARFRIQRATYIGIPAAQAQCVTLAASVREESTRFALGALRDQITHFEALQPGRACSCECVEGREIPHAFDVQCADFCMNGISTGIDAALSAVTDEVRRDNDA